MPDSHRPPFAPETAAPAPIGPSTLDEHTLAARALERARIVIVEDDGLNAAALEGVLRATGHPHVHRVAPSTADLQALGDHAPDLIVVDLPDAAQASGAAADAGLETLRAIRGARGLQHVPILALSSPLEAAARVRALQCGASDVLPKPVVADEFLLRMHSALALKVRQDALTHIDATTGLPTRQVLLMRLDWALKHARRHGTVGAVLQLGLDRFQQVAHTLGPTAADQLIGAVGQRLVADLRDSDTVAHHPGPHARALLTRAAGDEFTLLLPVIDRAAHAGVVAQRIALRMTEPFVVAGHELTLACRVGVAVFPGDGLEAEGLLHRAGLALHLTCSQGCEQSSCVRYHCEELHAQSQQRLSLERDLRHAVQRDELRLCYQPQVRTRDDRVSAAEALLRWQHPTQGLLAPGAFIAIAEESGLIVEIGAWVLRTAVHQVAQWQQRGMPPLEVAVNVSVLQLKRPGFLDVVKDALASSGLPASRLCLELTESVLIDNDQQVAATLDAIAGLGVRLALDDFGTGYSSLSYLHRFPIGELKIDRSFISDCGAGSAGARITAAILAMGQQLGMRVVAEGVETAPQLKFVHLHGADAVQGYLLAKPLPADEFVRFVCERDCVDAGLAAPCPVTAVCAGADAVEVVAGMTEARRGPAGWAPACAGIHPNGSRHSRHQPAQSQRHRGSSR